MNRGSLRNRHGTYQGKLTSMRPRFMNRGSAHRMSRAFHHGRHFNEAPIHESGKSRDPCSRRGRPPNFNEAPIHESGK